MIAQREVVRALSGTGAGNLARYLSNSRLSKYLDLEHIGTQTMQFAIPGTQFVATGYEATLLIEIGEYPRIARD